MRVLATLILALTLVAGGVARAAPAGSGPVNTGHLEAELVARSEGIAPGQTVWLAVRQTIKKDWHTYWRNPGDAGEPMKLAWTLPAGWRAGDIVWPTPRRLPVGPLMDYGYEGEVLLPVPLTAPATARPGEHAQIKVAASFLVCAETCVPEDAVLTLDLPVTAGPAPRTPRWGEAVDRALAQAPKPAPLQAVFERRADGLALAVTGSPLKGAEDQDAYFYPFSSTLIEHAQPQRIDRGPEGVTLRLHPGYDFQHGSPPAALAGVLVADGKAYEIAALPGVPPPGAAGLGPPPARLASRPGAGLALAAGFAFLGGLILNLMPCVFPVLAMKAAALAGHAGEQIGARRQGLAFGAGVLAAFLGLAGVLIGLKAAGAAVGWGFQLQSPAVVAGLALLIFAIALNLSGLFEVGSSLQSAGQGLASRRGLLGAFFTGALSVVVAAPCTAPFMGSALGWALTQPPAAALAVFAALAVGFALPFVLLAYAPGLIARLPRPGPWMEVFRKALAFPMYAAAAWLAWVLTVQAGAPALARLLAAAVTTALAAWLAGAAQRRRAQGGRAGALGGSAGALVAVALAVAVLAPYAAARPGVGNGPESAALAEQSYTPAKLAELRARGAPVFVNYTAAWCVSCQVNDRVALSTGRVAEAFRRGGVAYLKADWTLRDPVIAADLARFGRAGVPLYLVYPAGGGEPAVLPAILTEGLVLKALAAARAPGAGASVQARNGAVAGV
jgi:thiol:disulfide interchange protein DsbD